ncbi:MAG TPA: hypothetical protein VMU07_04090 [Candidatus Paceibacterota bacterium]|nr:hypothetical protein [Candidatus Paceibacterota bacterium]
MLTITQQQALNRWDLLTEPLREALFSDVNADFIEKVCQKENVPPRMQAEVSGIAGYVLMGFLHPGDLAEELVEELKLDKRTAQDIADAINTRIFVPLQQEIDKVYGPVTKTAAIPLSKVSEGKFGVSASTAASSPMSTTKIPAVSEGKFSAFAMTASQSASSLSQTGWSKTPASAVASGAAKVTNPAPSNEPAPMILHEDATFTASERANDIHLARPGGGAEVSLEGVNAQQKIKPAVLELGTLAKTPGQSTGPNFVHYSQFQVNPSQPSSSEPKSEAPSAPRTVTQVTAPAAVPGTGSPKTPTSAGAAATTPAAAPTQPTPPTKPASSPVQVQSGPLAQMIQPKPPAGTIPIPKPPQPPQTSKPILPGAPMTPPLPSPPPTNPPANPVKKNYP